MKKLIEFIFPCKEDKEYFKIKIVEAWFGGGYYCFRYSLNKGITWRYVYSSSEPILSGENYTWRRYSVKLINSNIESLMKKFDSYKKIKEFENKHGDIIKQGNIRLNNERKNYKEDISNKISKFNKR